MSGICNMPSKKLIVGLTGGIGSGKSTVARYFSDLGVEIIDTDVIAKKLLRPGTMPLAEILNRHGPKILTKAGELDRKALGALVFQNPTEKNWLEALLHPLIRDEVRFSIKDLKGPYGVVVIPLLVESGHYETLDRILVVDASEALQIERTIQREGVDEAYVRSILKTQATKEQRLAIATDLIVNEGDFLSLEKQVLKLHQQYLRL